MVHRYEGIETDKVVILPYDISGNKAELYTEEDMKKKFPMGYAYLKECEEVLKMRENGRLKNDINWYKYIYPKNLVNFKNEKLIAPDISKGCNFTYDQSGEFYSTSTVYGYIKNDFIKESYKFLMAVLNSKVLWYYLTNTGAVMANGFFRFKTSYIKPFPIPELKDLEMTKPFETLVDYIVFIKANRNSFEDLNASTDYLISFFEDILNFMAYELYFDKETQENELEIIKYAQRDLGALENKSFEDKVFEIKKSFIKISERENEIRNNMILMKLKLEDLIMPIERSI